MLHPNVQLICFQSVIPLPLHWAAHGARKGAGNRKCADIRSIRLFACYARRMRNLALTLTGATAVASSLLLFSASWLDAAPGEAVPGTPTKVLIPVRVWTNGDGRELSAALLNLAAEGVGIFRRPDGTTFEYEFDKLSERDQKLIADVCSEKQGRFASVLAKVGEAALGGEYDLVFDAARSPQQRQLDALLNYGRQLFLLLRVWSNDNDGNYPERLDQLHDEVRIDRATEDDLGLHHDELKETPFQLIGGVGVSSDDDAPLLLSTRRVKTHEGERWVIGYNNGSFDAIDSKALDRLKLGSLAAAGKLVPAKANPAPERYASLVKGHLRAEHLLDLAELQAITDAEPALTTGHPQMDRIFRAGIYAVTSSFSTKSPDGEQRGELESRVVSKFVRGGEYHVLQAADPRTSFPLMITRYDEEQSVLLRWQPDFEAKKVLLHVAPFKEVDRQIVWQLNPLLDRDSSSWIASEIRQSINPQRFTEETTTKVGPTIQSKVVSDWTLE